MVLERQLEETANDRSGIAEALHALAVEAAPSLQRLPPDKRDPFKGTGFSRADVLVAQ